MYPPYGYIFQFPNIENSAPGWSKRELHLQAAELAVIASSVHAIRSDTVSTDKGV